jgi:carbohydrate kinase (thermoresistant glucokinase family)
MIVMVSGIAGSGKTTVGELLAARLGWEFADGDRFHSPAAVAKMHAGIPLTDDDRWPWLDAIGAWVDQENAAGRSAIVACSALKRSYRHRLLAGRPELKMFFLVIGHDADEARLTGRHGHFFPEKLLDSQFATLELPEPSEGVVLIPATGTPEQAVDEIVRDLGQPA